MVRYRRGDVIEWLRSRIHASTAEYRTVRKRNRHAADARA
jgi:hypothetical protein